MDGKLAVGISGARETDFNFNVPFYWISQTRMSVPNRALTLTD